MPPNKVPVTHGAVITDEAAKSLGLVCVSSNSGLTSRYGPSTSSFLVASHMAHAYHDEETCRRLLWRRAVNDSAGCHSQPSCRIESHLPCRLAGDVVRVLISFWKLCRPVLVVLSGKFELFLPVGRTVTKDGTLRRLGSLDNSVCLMPYGFQTLT